MLFRFKELVELLLRENEGLRKELETFREREIERLQTSKETLQEKLELAEEGR